LSDIASVGAELARARQAKGLAIAEVAAQLKFAPRQLEALEQDKFDRLPGPTIARGMVRNYARLLKLEPEPLLQRLGERLPPDDASRLAQRFSQPVPFSDGARRSTLIYVGLSVGILVLVGGLMYEWRSERAAPDFVAPLAQSTPPSAPAAPRPLPVPAQTASLVPALPLIEDQPPPEVVEAKPVETKTAPLAARLVLRCEQESWIEVKDAAGKLLASSLNAAGTERVIDGRPPFDLIIGNAQHVRVRYNDRQVDLQPHIKVEVARLSLK
jgi:cytoskeleton protein RodZ